MKNEKGFTLIGVMIALALLGVIAVAFLGALATASHAIIVADEHATAESIARSQMEYVKNQPYIPATDYDPDVPGSGQVTYEILTVLTDIPDGYVICSIDRNGYTVPNAVFGVPWDSQNNQPADTDSGIQRISLIIMHYDKEIMTLENYKVNR
ncbi:MAG TPA: type II secretion system protein [Dehalococcoidia bacterium]|nr:type II secretion system protein [Dehalococcoidia bacterium]